MAAQPDIAELTAVIRNLSAEVVKTKQEVTKGNQIAEEFRKEIRNELTTMNQKQNRLDGAFCNLSAVVDIHTNAIKMQDQKINAMSHMQTKLNDLEDKIKRKNLRVKGLPESFAARGEEADKFFEWLRDGLNMPIEFEDIERAHWAVPRRNVRNRDLIVAFTRDAVRDMVFKNLRADKNLQYQGQRVFPVPDLSAGSLKMKFDMQDITNVLKMNNQKFMWGMPLILVAWQNNRCFRARNYEEGLKMLRDLGFDKPQPRADGGGGGQNGDGPHGGPDGAPPAPPGGSGRSEPSDDVGRASQAAAQSIPDVPSTLGTNQQEAAMQFLEGAGASPMYSEEALEQRVRAHSRRRSSIGRREEIHKNLLALYEQNKAFLTMPSIQKDLEVELRGADEAAAGLERSSKTFTSPELAEGLHGQLSTMFSMIQSISPETAQSWANVTTRSMAKKLKKKPKAAKAANILANAATRRRERREAEREAEHKYRMHIQQALLSTSGPQSFQASISGASGAPIEAATAAVNRSMLQIQQPEFQAISSNFPFNPIEKVPAESDGNRIAGKNGVINV